METVRYHCSLHEDLLINILLKLSVKSLLRFKSVCQQWRKIITSAFFVRNHFRESNSTSLLVYSTEELIIHPYNRVDVFSLFRVETLERYEDVEPIELIKTNSCIRGPCNGIFCVLYVDYTLALWNPATRRVRPVPPSPLSTDYLIKFRLGVDLLTDDIKIVFIAPKCVAIYSLTDDSWRVREEESIGNSCYSLTDSAPTLSNGFCYWLRFPRNTHDPYSIVVYDVHNELFQEIEMTECISRSIRVKLIWYGTDSVAVSTYYTVAGKYYRDIWIFKEQGCWVKILTFSQPQALSIHDIAGVWKRNQIFVVFTDLKLVIVIYDTDAGNTTTLEFRCTQNYLNIPVFSFMYKESLVSL